MANPSASSQVGGLGRTANAANSIPYTSALNVFSLLTGGAGDDGKFVKYVHPGSYVFANAAATDITQKFIVSGDISPSQLTGNQNDYSPTDLATSSVLRLSSDASRNITGLAGGEDGRVTIHFNVGSNSIVFKNQDVGSTAANRFLNPGSVDVTLGAEESVSYWYDSTTARHRPFAYHFGKLPIARGGTNSGTALAGDEVMVSTSTTIVESAIVRAPSGASGTIRLYETPANGTNYVALRAATSLSADTTFVLPSADGTNGQALTTNGSATLSWTTISGGTSPFSSTGGVITYLTSTDRLQLNVGETGDIGIEIRGIAAQTANFIDVKQLTTDSQPKFAINNAARITFGPGGSTAVDTLLYRSGANTLTMDHIIVSGTATAGGATSVTISPAAHTAQTAEKNDFLINAHTNTITGAITTQRFNWFRQPTITAASSLAVTTAVTVEIEAAPVAAGSATITNKYALRVGGDSQLNSSLFMEGGYKTWLNANTTGGGLGSTSEVPLFQFGKSDGTTGLTLGGNYTTQRFAVFYPHTINAGAFSVTNAATIAVAGPPTGGGATNFYSVWVQAGRTRLDGPVTLGPASTLTIATGAVTMTRAYHVIDTESAAASDDLDTISGGKEGDVLVIRALDSTHTVVAKDATGNLQLAGDATLDNAQDSLTLIFDGTDWLELARSNNGA